MSVVTDSELRGLVCGTLLPGFSGTAAPEWILAELGNGLAGVCLFGSNIVSSGQLKQLASSLREARPGAVIALDEEGGDVTRLHYAAGSPYPGNAVLGRLDNQAQTYACAKAIGTELSLSGCTMNLGPVIDINSNPENPVIGVRSFGSDPALVASHGAAWIRGLQSTGASACAKHFPGHGDTGQDSHLSLPVLDASLELLHTRELEPFRAAVAAGTAAIMTSHILVPALDRLNPATFSQRILQDLLRGDLGFTGVVVTDALDMYGASGESGVPQAAVRALAAGCDLLCLGSDTTEDEFATIVERIMEAVVSGELSIDRLKASCERVSRLSGTTPETEGQPDKEAEVELDVESAQEPAPAAAGSGGGTSVTTVLSSTVSAPTSSLVSSSARGPRWETEAVAAAFSISPEARAWLSRPGQLSRILQLDTVANMAVGHVPWGPVSVLENLTEQTSVEVVGQDEPPHVPAGTRVALVGRGLHLRPSSRTLVRELRGQDLDLIVVEMGWPSADGSLADMCTFGASQLVSRALLEMLTGRAGGME